MVLVLHGQQYGRWYPARASENLAFYLARIAGVILARASNQATVEEEP